MNMTYQQVLLYSKAVNKQATFEKKHMLLLTKAANAMDNSPFKEALGIIESQLKE